MLSNPVIGFQVFNDLLTLNGPGFNNVGALHNLSGSNIWNGGLTLGSPLPNTSDITIGVEANTQLTVSGVVGDDPNRTGPDTPALHKTLPGKLIFDNANTYRGNTFVEEGILTARDSQALGSSVPGTGSVTVGPSGGNALAALEYQVDQGLDGTPQRTHNRNLGFDSVRKTGLWQEIVVPGTSGTFTLSFNGASTGPLNFDATAAQVQAALQALPTIGANNVIVTQDATVYRVTFANATVEHQRAAFERHWHGRGGRQQCVRSDGFQEPHSPWSGHQQLGHAAQRDGIERPVRNGHAQRHFGIDWRRSRRPPRTPDRGQFLLHQRLQPDRQQHRCPPQHHHHEVPEVRHRTTDPPGGQYSTQRPHGNLGGLGHRSEQQLARPAGGGPQQGRDRSTRLDHGSRRRALHLLPLAGDLVIPNRLILAGQGITHPFAVLEQGALLSLKGNNRATGDIGLTTSLGGGPSAGASQVGIGVDDPVTTDPPDASTLTTTGTISDFIPTAISITGLTASGGGDEQAFEFDTGGISGRIRIDYDFLSIPDELRVYYPPRSQGAVLIFDSGLINGAGTFNVNYGPGTSTSVEIVMNEGGQDPGMAWFLDNITITPNVPPGGNGILKMGSGLLSLQGDGTYKSSSDCAIRRPPGADDSALGRNSSGTATDPTTAILDADPTAARPARGWNSTPPFRKMPADSSRASRYGMNTSCSMGLGSRS